MATSAQNNEETAVGNFNHLQTSKSSHRLNQIEKIRSYGVGDMVALPQLVVCGDQSAGKSSVLEGLTGIPFPRDSGLCTRFPTEIILRHTDEESVNYTTSIRPHASRPAGVKRRLSGYRREVKDLSELPQIIVEVSQLLNIRGHVILSDNIQQKMASVHLSPPKDLGHAFARDILRIEVTGPIGLYLSVVDLPGLISTPNEEQTEGDVEAVRDVVESYIESSRTIILAVLQAGNDMANQSIIRLARKHDSLGERTVGIITKPDLINKGTEAMLALTAKNQGNIRFNLGFFLLKNPSPEELKEGLTPNARSRLEQQFFSSPTWASQDLDVERVGIERLRGFLQTLLDTHIERELPNVRNEIRKLLAAKEDELQSLGDSRSTVDLIRTFLTRLSMKFYQLLQASLDGNYHTIDAAFFSENNESRLRARVQELNTTFAARMRDSGQKRNLLEPALNSLKDGEPFDSIASRARKIELTDWIQQAHSRTRGKELPGNHNPALLQELFREQSSPWLGIAELHVDRTIAIVRQWIDHALERLHPEKDVQYRIQIILYSWLINAQKSALGELQKLIDDERRGPLTYNHYYTDNVQKTRLEAQRQAVQRAVHQKKDSLGRLRLDNERDIESFVEAIKITVTADMDEEACNEALIQLGAYYKVAMKTFVDNVARQVIERHIIAPLPDAFCPSSVSDLSKEDLIRIGAESKEQIERRKMLAAQVQGLKKSLNELSVPA
ncbi:P-loop containing nucleoside triphosphate hydrolase protein [Trichoderma aethiopicum]